MNKLKRFVANSSQPNIPPPLPDLTWAMVDALEASLLVSVVSTSKRLHEIMQAPAEWEPQLLTIINTCRTRYSEIMISAQICSNALNKMRDGTFQGNPALLEVILKALRFVKDAQNPILPDFTGKFEERPKWIHACRTYVEDIVVTLEHTSSVLKSAGFS